MTQFYAYVHARPNTKNASGIFYVGKGSGGRAQNLCQRNQYHTNVIRKYGDTSILIGVINCSSENVAFDLERGLIKCLRRMRIKLTNQTDGGDGVKNLSPEIQEIKRQNIIKALASSEVRNKMSVGIREAKSSPEARLKMSEAAKYERTPAMRKAMSEKVITDEAKTNMSISARVRCENQEWKDQQSQRMLGRVWVNNGAIQLLAKPDAIPSGFVRGMLTNKSNRTIE